VDIKIRKLTSDLVDDYVNFFDTTPHSDNVDDHKCYCVCWCGQALFLVEIERGIQSAAK